MQITKLKSQYLADGQISVKYASTLAALVFSTLSLSAQSEAENKEPIYELAPFTVAAEDGQTVLTITERDLHRRLPNDLEDALSIDPSVTVGGSTAIAQKIYVRNLGEDLLNISIDGATQVGALFHHTGRIVIEPELLKKIEIQPGVGSATDGPGALGGAIRFVTKDAEDLLRGDQNWGGMLKYGYFSNTAGHKGSATGYGRLGGGWSTLVSVVVADHGNIEDGDGNELNGSGSRQEVGLIKLRGEFGEGHVLKLSIEDLDESGKKLRRPEWAPGPGNPLYPMGAHRRTAVLNYGFNPDSLDWLDLAFTASYTSADLFQDVTDGWGIYQGEVKGTQFDLRNHHEIGDLELTYGMDHRKDEIFAGDSANPRSVSEEGDVTGVFIQGSYDISDYLTVNAGGRYDEFSLTDSDSQTFEVEGFSPNIGLQYKITPQLSLNTSYATARSGPEMLDAFIIGAASNEPDLTGERAHNYELRLVYAVGGITLEGGAYHNKIEDVITTTIPWVRVYDNAGDLETDGFFARASYTTSRFNFGLQYNHADTTLDGQIATRYQYGSLVSRIGDTWVADVTWRALDQLDVGWNVRHVQSVDGISISEDITEVPNSQIDKPSYTTHDIYLVWQPDFAEFLTINLVVKNVFDEQYISHGAIENLTAFPGYEAVIGAPEQGRDIRISASIRF